MTPEPQKTKGHRGRLRERFMKSGVEGFHDYEIVELLLTLGTPRRDCKQQAKDAIKRFKTLRGVFEASAEELQEIEGIGPHCAFGIRLVQEVARKFLKERILERPIYTSSKEVFEYLYHAMRGLKKETFKILFLDAKNRVIEVEDLFEGTLNVSSVYPREVVKSALGHHAASLIFVHNHPSGTPDPSRSDREITQELVFAGSIMQLKVLDHIIIGDNRYFSFADEGLIEEYEGRFSRMKERG